MKRPGRMIQEALKSVFKKPATLNYPAVKVEMPEGFRGKLSFDPAKCICCKLCMRDCPADAIKITKVGTDEVTCEIDLSKCIYCAQCVDSCPKGALRATREFELAGLQRDKLRVTFHGKCAKPAPAKPPVPPEKKP